MGGFIRSKLFVDEDFISYFATPLIAKGQAKGVFELFHRSQLHPEPDWLDFIETIASQAGYALLHLRRSLQSVIRSYI